MREDGLIALRRLQPGRRLASHAAVYDAVAQTKQLYLDGSPLGSAKTGISAMTVSDANHVIGVQDLGATPTRYFDGLIDELRIWDVARSAGDIAGDYDDELTGSETGLMAYYKFNDFTDSAGSADGTAVNGASISAGDNAPVYPLSVATSGMLIYFK